MKQRYFDMLLKIRNRHEIEMNGFAFVAYEDLFMGEWIGNVNVFDKDGINIMHATTTHALDAEELKELAKNLVRHLKG